MYRFQDAIVDSDHDFIIRRFEDMRGLATSEGYDWLGRKAFVDAFIGYTSSHFAQEEAIMRTSGYPGYGEHLMAHAYLQREFSSMLKTMPEGSPNLASDIAAFRQMFIFHILTYDEAYGEWRGLQNQHPDKPGATPPDGQRAVAPWRPRSVPAISACLQPQQDLRSSHDMET